MRVYKFLCKKHALDNLTKKRIKISEYADMNDPFELRGVKLSDRNVQNLLQDSIRRIGGALCFSRNWKNPVLWSHYGCKHRGICLGFDFSATWEREAQEPRYVDDLPVHDSEILVQAASDLQRLDATDPPLAAVEVFKELFLMKFKDWSYEDEVRIWLMLQEDQKDGNLYFANLDGNIQPSTVIIGSRCSLTTSEVEALNAAISRYPAPITVVQAMLSPTSFEVIEDPGGFKVCHAT